LLHCEFDRLPCELSSRQNPSLPISFQNVGVELPIANERSDHLSIFAAESFHLRAHLQLDTFDSSVC
jgi:hypothetical protein